MVISRRNASKSTLGSDGGVYARAIQARYIVRSTDPADPSTFDPLAYDLSQQMSDDYDGRSHRRGLLRRWRLRHRSNHVSSRRRDVRVSSRRELLIYRLNFCNPTFCSRRPSTATADADADADADAVSNFQWTLRLALGVNN